MSAFCATSVVGRFAPSPTGPLHFGSLVAAVGSFCLARQAGGRWLVRIEDLDGPRVVPGASDDILRTLERLGLCWDGEVLFQSRRAAVYAGVLHELRQAGRVFACGCSRREVLASAPHHGEEGPIYPGTCRDGLPPGRAARSWRLRVPEQKISFEDGVFGWRCQHLAREVGDFVLRRADGLFAYQLAVVVDDAACGVTQVVRGADLLGSTPRQIFLHHCLDYAVPAYVHLPLVLASNGEKISKRHGAVRIGDRENGGESCGAQLWRALRFLGQPVPDELCRAPADEVLAWGTDCFELGRVPREGAQG
jgi:glutamyl-Q tRNA(Asp) synthetase